MKTRIFLSVVIGVLLSAGLLTAQCTPPSVTAVTGNVTACKGSSASFLVIATGSAPLTYQWQQNAGAGFADLIGGSVYAGVNTATLTITTATVTMNNYAFHCVVTGTCMPTATSNSVVLTVPNITAVMSSTNIDCSGTNKGTASITTAGGGNAPYTYLWSPAGSTTSSVANLTAGTYSCMITDANICFITKTVTISKPSATTSQTNVSCNGASTGVATVSVSGGTTPYSYLWGPVGGTNASATGLAAGTYSCVITDALGCQLIKTVVITQNGTLTGNIFHTDVLCYGTSTGNASVSASGSLPFSYTWIPTGGSASVASNIPAGTYSCTVHDAFSCQITKTVTVSEPPALTALTGQTDILCNGLSTGSANVSAGGGISPYTYQWLPAGGTTTAAVNLFAGTYSCATTDKNNCVLTKTLTIAQPLALTASKTQTNILCNGTATGSANISVAGGTSSYNYLWMPSGGAAANATNLTAGNYSCTITDANSCVKTVALAITQLPAITAVITQQNACSGSAAGSAYITADGGTPPLSYLWTPGGNTATAVSNLTAGGYSITTKDANNCTLAGTFTIVQSTPPVVTLTASNYTICANSGLVTLTGTPSGGIYNGDGVSGSNFNTAIVIAGTYSVTYFYTDVLGCTGSKTINIDVEECLGVFALHSPSVKIYPNPFTNSTTLEVSPQFISNDDNIFMEIYDNLGRVIKQEYITESRTTITFDNLQTGIYYYRIRNDEGIITKGKLVLQ